MQLNSSNQLKLLSPLPKAEQFPLIFLTTEPHLLTATSAVIE